MQETGIIILVGESEDRWLQSRPERSEGSPSLLNIHPLSFLRMVENDAILCYSLRKKRYFINYPTIGLRLYNGFSYHNVNINYPFWIWFALYIFTKVIHQPAAEYTLTSSGTENDFPRCWGLRLGYTVTITAAPKRAIIVQRGQEGVSREFCHHFWRGTRYGLTTLTGETSEGERSRTGQGRVGQVWDGQLFLTSWGCHVILHLRNSSQWKRNKSFVRLRRTQGRE
jgi:hypothetical protein